MRKVKICMEEVASYEFEMEVAEDMSDEDIAEVAESHFVEIGVANCQCEVHSREIGAIDGVRY